MSMAARKRRQKTRRNTGPSDPFDRFLRGIGAAGVSLVRLVLFALRALLRGLFLAARFCVCLPFRLLSALLCSRDPARRCLNLSGEEFEAYCARVLRSNGFRHVELTPQGGDQGVDILAVRGGESWAVQCKNYSGAVGNFAVQEVAAGQAYYGCDRAAVLCPGSFTRAAWELAEANRVNLWDGKTLKAMIRRHGRLP